MINTQIRLTIFFAAKDGEALYSQQKLGADCGSDHELLIAKFRLKLKKVGKNHWKPTPVLLHGKSHGWRSLIGCSPWGH